MDTIIEELGCRPLTDEQLRAFEDYDQEMTQMLDEMLAEQRQAAILAEQARLRD